MHDLALVLGDDGIVICSNGAFVYDPVRRVILAEHVMDPAATVRLVADLRQTIPDVAFARENRTGFGREKVYVDLHGEPPGTPIGPIEMLLTPPPGKLLAQSAALPDDEFFSRVSEVVGNRAVVTWSGIGGLAEISGTGVTKATAIADFCEERGIGAKDVWAFGDMPNDLAMMRWAGTSLAVSNAAAEVLAAATVVCPSNDEDGVALHLDRLADLLDGGPR
jgi:hydroxymethylpyrimidine pyrophosphatase-like HAD family hydrolase